jgi:Fur family transcriptional regulator, ferric uptake regulator
VTVRARGGPEFDDVYRELSRASCRVTGQRKAIVTAFAHLRRYVTAKELHDHLRAAKVRIALATVYRTLEVLQRIGAASAAPQAHGETAYLFCAISHHHHAVCVRCGRVDDVPCRSAAGFARSLAGNLRFRLTQHKLEFFGLCARCS